VEFAERSARLDGDARDRIGLDETVRVSQVPGEAVEVAENMAGGAGVVAMG
jgi:hypothetical protein